MVDQNQFGRVNQKGMFATTTAFTPSPYILLQVITSTPIYTIEVSNSSGRIEKFNRRLGVRMRLTLSKVGAWSPPGLSQLQSSIAKVKTPCLEVFFIPLERP
jgi:hypothetical protein